MSRIKKSLLSEIGYDFVPEAYLPKGKDEYHVRFQQNPQTKYRSLTAQEIIELERNENSSDDWNKVLVTNKFSAKQIKRCKFYGLIRIGDIEPYYLEYHDLRLECGIYNSTIISSDIGDNVAIHHVKYMAHCIVGNDAMLTNISELSTSNHAKFGNGIIKEGEDESLRIELELCNENGGRNVLPFDGMQAADVFLWTRYRDDKQLQQRFKELTDSRFSKQRGAYSIIGNATVIKNCHVIKDVKIGTDAYLKGVNKIKNVTINSSNEARTQIGEGCELVNGVIGYGCRVFYGVKAVRFILAAHSQLKYGARLINSFLGDNSTISCCEVLNSLIFQAHEQHHNNSFLCASLLYGQSNMAAGATVGSNHNSRAADGEIIAGRGFWPGLCVSLKHNSKFASYILIVKGDFLHEMNIKLPFSLVSNDIKNDKLVLIPAYWFMYNMYALARNPNKYEARDKRKFKNQVIEYDIFAPDTINEMFEAMRLLKIATARSYYADKNMDERTAVEKGGELLEQKQNIRNIEVLMQGVENSARKVQVVKVTEAYHMYKRMIKYYGITQLVNYINVSKQRSVTAIVEQLATGARTNWQNIGGQLMPSAAVKQLIHNIKEGTLDSWDDVHAFYHQYSRLYTKLKREHAFTSLLEILNLARQEFTEETLLTLLDEVLETKRWISSEIRNTRAKDYDNEFKKMVYESEAEMNEVVGSLKDNSFINQQQAELEAYEQMITELKKSYTIEAVA